MNGTESQRTPFLEVAIKLLDTQGFLRGPCGPWVRSLEVFRMESLKPKFPMCFSKKFEHIIWQLLVHLSVERSQSWGKKSSYPMTDPWIRIMGLVQFTYVDFYGKCREIYQSHGSYGYGVSDTSFLRKLRVFLEGLPPRNKFQSHERDAAMPFKNLFSTTKILPFKNDAPSSRNSRVMHSNPI